MNYFSIHNSVQDSLIVRSFKFLFLSWSPLEPPGAPWCPLVPPGVAGPRSGLYVGLSSPACSSNSQSAPGLAPVHSSHSSGFGQLLLQQREGQITEWRPTNSRNRTEDPSQDLIQQGLVRYILLTPPDTPRVFTQGETVRADLFLLSNYKV